MPYPLADGRDYAFFPRAIQDPTPLAGAGKLYTKRAGPAVHLFYISDAGVVYQLTPTAGGGSDLQAAYDAGSSIVLSDAEGPIDVTDTALTLDLPLLALTKGFAGGLAPAISVSLGAANLAPAYRAIRGTQSAALGPDALFFDDSTGGVPFRITPFSLTPVGANPGTGLDFYTQDGGTGGSDPGDFNFFGGNPTSAGAEGAGFVFRAGGSLLISGVLGGSFEFYAGDSLDNDAGGFFAYGGNTVDGNASTVGLKGGDASGTGSPGPLDFEAGHAFGGLADGARVRYKAGDSVGGEGGFFTFEAGAGAVGDGAFVLGNIPGGGGLQRTALYFEDISGDRSGFVAPANYVTPVLWELPTSDGLVDTFLRTNGAGVLSFIALTSTLISNLSGVAGATVTAALNTLSAAILALTSSDIANSSNVPGASVTSALNNLYNLGLKGIDARAASFTITAAEVNRLQQFTAAGAVNLTINNGILAADDIVYWMQYGAGVVTINGTATLRSRGALLNSNGQYSYGAIIMLGANEALVVGDRA